MTEREVRRTFLLAQVFLLACVPLRVVFSVYGAGLWTAIFITKFVLALSLCRLPMRNSAVQFVLIVLVLSITPVAARFQKNHDFSLFLVEFGIALVVVPATYWLPAPARPGRSSMIAGVIFVLSIGLGIPDQLIPWLTGFST